MKKLFNLNKCSLLLLFSALFFVACANDNGGAVKLRKVDPKQAKAQADKKKANTPGKSDPATKQAILEIEAKVEASKNEKMLLILDRLVGTEISATCTLSDETSSEEKIENIEEAEALLVSDIKDGLLIGAGTNEAVNEKATVKLVEAKKRSQWVSISCGAEKEIQSLIFQWQGMHYKVVVSSGSDEKIQEISEVAYKYKIETINLDGKDLEESKKEELSKSIPMMFVDYYIF